MSAPAQANATVLAVRGAGVSDDWDRAGSTGADKWTGRARAYYRESTDRILAGGAVTVLPRRELILLTDDLALMELDTDDVITFELDNTAVADPVNVEAKAKVITRRDLAGLPDAVRTARVELDDVA